MTNKNETKIINECINNATTVEGAKAAHYTKKEKDSVIRVTREKKKKNKAPSKWKDPEFLKEYHRAYQKKWNEAHPGYNSEYAKAWRAKKKKENNELDIKAKLYYTPEEGIEFYSSTYGGTWKYNKERNCFASDLGLVGSITKSIGLHRNKPSKNGYYKECGTTRQRLIWETFNGPIPEGMEIDHISNDKSDNSLKNLQLLSHADNIKKRDLNGAPWSGLTGSKHPRSKKVVQKDKEGNIIQIWGSANSAAKAIGISQSCITLCCLKAKGAKSAGGFIWEFYKE